MSSKSPTTYVSSYLGGNCRVVFLAAEVPCLGPFKSLGFFFSLSCSLLIDSFSEEQMKRYEMFLTSKIRKSSMLKVSDAKWTSRNEAFHNSELHSCLVCNPDLFHDIYSRTMTQTRHVFECTYGSEPYLPPFASFLAFQYLQLLTNSQPNDRVVMVVAGIAKVFAGEVIEEGNTSTICSGAGVGSILGRSSVNHDNVRLLGPNANVSPDHYST